MSETGQIGTTEPRGDGPRMAVICAFWPDYGDASISRRLRALESEGVTVEVWALAPGSARRMAADEEIQGAVHVANRNLSDRPGAALGAMFSAMSLPGFGAAFAAALGAALRRGPGAAFSVFGKACALAGQSGETPDFIYAMEPGAPADAARCAAALFNAPWGLRAHGDALHALTDGQMKALMDEAVLVTASAPSIAAKLTKLALEGRKALFLPDGLDFAAPPAPPEHRTPHRGEFALEEIHLLAVGAPTPRKGWRELLEALTEMPPGMHWSIDIVGDGPERAALNAMAGRLGLGSRVRFIGAQPESAVMRLMREAHIFIAPAGAAALGGHSGLPASVLEAALQQMAIIAARSPDLAGLFEQEVSALFCRQGRAAEMAEAIARAARDTSLRATMGAAARARVLELGRNSAAKTLRAAIDSAIKEK